MLWWRAAKLPLGRSPIKLLGLALLFSGGAAEAAPSACEGLIASSSEAKGALRRIGVDDLVRLRDVGARDVAPFQSQFGISPDRRHIAFVIQRADPVSNRYCVALAVMDLVSGLPPRIIDEGDDLILDPWQFRDLYQPRAQGTPTLITPKWAPDGHSVAYLKRIEGVTQVWRVNLDGRYAKPISTSAADVTAFAWTGNGRALVYSSRPGLPVEDAQRRQDALSGFLYDERFVPNASNRPSLKLPVPYEAFVSGAAGGQTRRASAAEAALVLKPAASEQETVSTNGSRAWISRTEPGNLLSPNQLNASGANGAQHRCLSAACTTPAFRGIIGMWWGENDQDLLFLRWQGFAGSELGLYRWTVQTRQVRQILATEDLLTGCQLIGSKLICARDASKEPRRIVSIDAGTGAVRTLFDPNPQFSALDLGSVERLHWKNEFGLPGFGDLVLPPDYRPGNKLPLIIVQYRTSGFLRGGTGDEYPIFALAARGYAVLSVDNPPAYYTTAGSGMRDVYDAQRLNQVDWNERRSILSSTLAGIKILVDRGVVDQRRIGITGLSDGASSVEFALVNSDIFAAAAVSTCCFVGKSMMVYGGLAVAEDRKHMGFPAADGADVAAWRSNSLALNADRVRVPLLMQVADNEYVTALDAFTALHDAHRPVELYVFEDEYHIKWQPAHRAAIYRRVIDWFDYWLLGRENQGPDSATQYARWAKLRDQAK